MKNKSLFIILFSVIILAAVMFILTRTGTPDLPVSNPSDSTATNALTTSDRLFDEPKGANKPAVNEVNGASSTTYSPVYPVNIGSESVKNPVSLHYNVPDGLRLIYVQILGGLQNRQKDITLTRAENEDDFMRALIYVRDFNPELFFVDWTVYNYKATDDKKVSEINFNFIDGDIESMSATLESEVEKIVSQANRLPNMFERELFVHDWLVNNVSYTVDTANSGSAYGALVEHRARCEGYARAFELIMLRLGAPTYSVIGTAESQRHMWNAVNLYGEHYFVDVTFDDNPDEQKTTSYAESEISHSCFNIPAQILTKTHSISGAGSTDKYGAYQNLFLPECNSDEFGYYRIRGLTVENLEQFKYILEKNASSKRACVFFNGDMPSSDAFNGAFAEFFRNTYTTGSYSINYSPENSPVYKRNVYEISWTVN